MPARIQSVSRAAEILELLAEPPGRFALGEIAQHLKLPRTTVHGLIQTLCHHQIVRQECGGDQYLLGPTLLRLGQRYLNQDEVRTRCAPWVTWLAERSGLITEVAVPYRADGVIVVLSADTADCAPPGGTVGSVLPATTSALGRAVLAYRAADSDTDGALPADAVARAVRGVRRRSMAIDRGKLVPGRVGLAAPLFAGRDGAVGAIGVTGSAEDLANDRLDRVGTLVIEAARGASTELGAIAWPADA